MLKIQSAPDPKENAAAYINSLIVSNENKPILLMLAGGSALSVVELIDPEIISDKITVTVTDERYTDDLVENNFSSLQSTSFYGHLINVNALCIDTQIFSGETHSEHAERLAKNLSEWKRDFSDGKIIALFGVGKDGHIAGIIPGVEDFDTKFSGEFATDLLAVSNQHVERTTVTFPFMKTIDFPLVYMVGNEKADALKKIVAKEGSLNETPARILNEMKDPIIFTDISVERA